MDVFHADILMLGGGLSSWMAAHALLKKRDCRVIMLSDGFGASPWVHGFNTPLHPEDSVESFYQDVRQSGYRQNDPALARALCGDSPEIFRETQALGAVYNRNADGSYQLLRPLGASHPRVASIGNETGPDLLDKLQKEVKAHPGFTLFPHARGLRLMVKDGRVQGALGWNRETQAFFAVSAGTVLLATGGFGRIFPFSTNKPDGGGDGIAMAYYAGAKLVDMEFIQFEPSAAVYPDAVRGQGMITTLFYEGAVLKNALGERFMLQYGPKGEQVNKDVLSRCIAKEIREGRGTAHGGVYFDATGVPKERLEEAYPMYVERYRKVGIELSETPIELAPAPHTTLGGVMIHENCLTSLPGLIAAGEVTGGIHGANRLGGNGGLETLVFGRRAGLWLREAELLPGAEEASLLRWAEEEIRPGKEPIGDAVKRLRGVLEDALQQGAYVLRDGASIESALQTVCQAQHELNELPGASPEASYERLRLENDLIAARLTLLSALERRETVGCHVRLDYPGREAKPYRVVLELKDNVLQLNRQNWTKQAEEA